MNETNSKDITLTKDVVNNSENDKLYNTKIVQAYAESSISETNIDIENIFFHNNHKHNSNCFTTEVFLHGIRFILKKQSHNLSPNIVKRVESISSTDDGYIDDTASSLQWSSGSERGRVTTSGTFSDGFQETGNPNTAYNHIDTVLHSLNANLRVSICNGCQSLPRFSQSFYQSLEHVLVYFQNKYHSCQWLGSSAIQLSATDLSEAKQELNKVYESMFQERINWGRIVAMIGFVGELSVCALSADRLELINEYVKTSVCYLEDNLMAWITDHGGWEGLVEFEAGQRYDGMDLDNVFGSLGRLAGVAALALAGVAIYSSTVYLTISCTDGAISCCSKKNNNNNRLYAD